MKQNKKTNRWVFAMLTDFGFDFSVASMKALILKNFPNAQIVDVDHSVKQFSILSGAFVIDKIYNYFPEQTIFICVIDPGVGSKREPIFIDTGNYKFIGPNNGLFHYILNDPKISYKSYAIKSYAIKSYAIKSYAIKEEFRSVRSTTFHGRDLFTPAAIEIAKGNFDIVEPIDKEKIVLIPLLNAGTSVITYIDGFGNIKTNIPFRDEFKKKDFLRVNVNNTLRLIKVSNTFSDVASGELLCYKGSNDILEIAANLTSAEKILNAEVGNPITVE